MTKSLAMVAAGLLLASCVAHGGQVNLSSEYKNYTPYDMSFYRQFLTDRAWVFHNQDNREYHNIPHGVIFHADGVVSRCIAKGTGPDWVSDVPQRWSVSWDNHGALVKYETRGKNPGYARFFYDPETGAMDVEILREVKDGIIWTRPDAGWVQDSWPRVLADACPDLPLPSRMAVNEKQTSHKLDEMREQDPSAPIRHFPGSDLTAPGRTGLAASNGGATTTKDAVLAYLHAQEGNILIQYQGAGRVFVRGPGKEHELWRLHMTDPDKPDFSRVMREVSDASGDWIDIVNRRTGKITRRYPMGYPFPYLPTGYRHAAFLLTDALIESGEPVVLPWMPKEWKDFAFRADGKVLARRANGGPDRLAPWRWTKARLWVQTGDNREAPGWEEVAEQLGMTKPKLWTRADGQRIEVASAEPATSGTGKCVGDHEGVATWTLGADGKRVWDTSGCQKRTE